MTSLMRSKTAVRIVGKLERFRSWNGALHVNFSDTVQDNVRCLTAQPIKLLVKQYKQPSQNNF